MGLSATPERYGDPDGTARIRAYFGDDLKPSVTLKDAIVLGRLCPYDYYADSVVLDDEETEEWGTLSHQISVLAAQSAQGSAKQTTI